MRWAQYYFFLWLKKQKPHLINGKSYKSEYTGQSVKDTVYSFLKDMNYYSWSDGSFVPMTKETCEFLNMTEDKNKQERIEVNF